MAYSFDLLGVTPVLTFFNYQQRNEQDPHRPKAYLGAFQCTLDGFIDALELMPKKPQWDWDEVVATMVKFWLRHGDRIRECETEFKQSMPEGPQLVIARVSNIDALRHNFEAILGD